MICLIGNKSDRCLSKNVKKQTEEQPYVVAYTDGITEIGDNRSINGSHLTYMNGNIRGSTMHGSSGGNNSGSSKEVISSPNNSNPTEED